ncbi:MAG: sugar phosphate isomerase/epimerase family protein [Inquilinus sp.]|uniref:sugar phosphate isomerase/epimerase family protein n=1 Tax=Inquilinus sp. TaxID=1932117 RepID=UPI003F308B7F
MQLSLTSWSLRACSLHEAASIARALGIGGLDLGYFYGPALDKAALLADPDGMAETVRALGIHVPSFYHLFGDSLSDRNLADPRHRDRNVADFRKAVQFCARAEIDTIFILPGVCNPGQGRAQALEESARSLNALVPIALEAGVTPTIEPHVHSFLETPTLVQELLARVEGLRLTLDYAHFVCLGYRQEEIDPLARHAAHVHLRQARPGALQAKGHEGTINIEAQLATLRDAGFQGHLALEYVHQDYMATLHDDVLTETIRMRDQVRGWLA